jgi:hypothetical protein
MSIKLTNLNKKTLKKLQNQDDQTQNVYLNERALLSIKIETLLENFHLTRTFLSFVAVKQVAIFVGKGLIKKVEIFD